ncbi:hypothetical protein P7C70_g1118, partial [Phenoliferia sp. Uapishka_3]
MEDLHTVPSKKAVKVQWIKCIPDPTILEQYPQSKVIDEDNLVARGCIKKTVRDGWAIGVRESKDPDGSVYRRVVFTARFEEAEDLLEEGKRSSEMLLRVFNLLAKGGGNAIKRNGAHVKSGGAGGTHTRRVTPLGLMLHRQQVGPGRAAFDAATEEMPQELLEQKFRSQYPGVFNANIKLAKAEGLPAFNHAMSYKDAAGRARVFATNLTVTNGSFCNSYHLDKDANIFTTCGCWLDTFHGKLCGSDLAYVERASRWHVTTLSSFPLDYDHWGLSAQVSAKLFSTVVSRATNIKDRNTRDNLRGYTKQGNGKGKGKED